MNYKANRKQWLVETYGEPETLEQLFELHKQVISSQLDRTNKLLGLAWSISYRERLSNTHYAPIHGETNWGCKPEKPSGYPGFTGRVWIRMEHSPRNGWVSWVSELFNKALSYPGTGGYGSYDGPWKAVSSAQYKMYGRQRDAEFPEVVCYSWDYRFFSADYPLLVGNWIKDKMFDIIKTNVVPDISEYREWNDPEQEELDKAFLSYAELQNEMRWDV